MLFLSDDPRIQEAQRIRGLVRRREEAKGEAGAGEYGEHN